MQDLIKRHFWVLGIVVVLVCSIFAAKATGSILEAKFLGDAPKAPKPPPTPAMSKKPEKVVHSKDGAQLATRNMFCSTCTPAVATTPTATDPTQIQNTGLPISLLATNVGSTPKQSYATIINTESQKQGSYMVGETIPGASGKISVIAYKYVDFENGGHMERVSLAGTTPPPPPPTTVASNDPPPDGEKKDDMEAMIDAGIKKTGENSFEVDKNLIAKVRENPMAFMKGARVVPSTKNGKVDGIKLYAIRPNSPYAKLGLSNGDTLNSVNGFELNSMDKGLEIYTKLAEATSLELEVTRRGKPVTLKYSIK